MKFFRINESLNTFPCRIFEKSSALHVLPLTVAFHKDMKLVHLGGLPLLPTEKVRWFEANALVGSLTLTFQTVNPHTLDIETLLSENCHQETVNVFKRIMMSSNLVSFVAEFQLAEHKFGSLAIETEAGVKDINKILLAMNKMTSIGGQYLREGKRDTKGWK